MRIVQTLAVPLVVGAVLASNPATAEPRSVLASILPVHSLVAGLVDGIHEAGVLLPASASPHGYAMRPSEARLLQDANLFVWVGPDLETFLQRPLAEHREGRKVIGLIQDLDLELLPTREGGVWEAHLHDHGQGHGHDHGHKHDHGHDHTHGQTHAHHQDHDHRHGPAHGHAHKPDHGHDHGHKHQDVDSPDAHVWLSPANARRIATGLADQLMRWDPANAQSFARNRDALLARIDALDAELAARLEPVRDLPFIVFHDAYQYFEHAYGLNAAGSITVDPSLVPGARRIQELRNRMNTDDVVCLFTEPQFRPAMAKTLVEGHRTRLGELDPLGSDLQPGPDAWFELMRNLADDLTACLAPAEGP